MKLRNNNQIPSFIKREIRAREREMAIAMQASANPDELSQFAPDPYVPKGSLYPSSQAFGKANAFSKNTPSKTDTKASDKIKSLAVNDAENLNQTKTSGADSNSLSFVKAKSKNLHSGHRERLKQQYLSNGISAMTDIQQLELLLFYAIPQKDTNPIAHKLLERFGTIKNVLNASVYDLCTIDGIKESSATFLKLISNMANVCSKPQERELINSTRLAREYCQKFYVGVPLEQFHVVCLSKDSKVIGSKMIKAGTVDEIKVDIRDITEFAISINCTRILVSHNHPEGKGEMSDEDLKFTYSLVCSCLLNNIDIIDHIIVGQDANYSLSEHGIMSYLKQRAFKKVLVPKDTQIIVSSTSDKYIISESYPTIIKDVKL